MRPSGGRILSTGQGGGQTGGIFLKNNNKNNIYYQKAQSKTISLRTLLFSHKNVKISANYLSNFVNGTICFRPIISSRRAVVNKVSCQARGLISDPQTRGSPLSPLCPSMILCLLAKTVMSLDPQFVATSPCLPSRVGDCSTQMWSRSRSENSPREGQICSWSSGGRKRPMQETIRNY